MKKAILFTGLISSMLFVVSCAKKTTGAIASSKTTEAVEAKEQSPEAAIAEIKGKYNGDQITEGKTIWHASCEKCHKLYAPVSHTVKEWEKILPRMVKRAKLTDEEAGKVRAYVLVNASSFD